MHALGTTALTKLWELIKGSFARGGGSNGVYYIEGASTTEGAWLGSHAGITGYYAGLMVAYKPDVAGSSDGTTLNINGLGAVPVVRNASSAITTHYGASSVVYLVYTEDSGTAYWKCVDYDSDKKVSQYSTTTSASYPLLFKYASGTSSTSTTTNYVRYSNKLYCNPSTGVIAATKFSGALSGNATSATKATQDGNGKVIADTYATKEELSNVTSGGGLTATVLYSHATGTTGTVTLTDSAANYTFIDIISSTGEGRQSGTTRVYQPNGKTVEISTGLVGSNGYHGIFFGRYTVSGTSITPGLNYRWGANLNGTEANDANLLNIIAVIGYK